MSSSASKKTATILAFTGGDPNGIGPEVVLKAAAHSAVRRLCTPLLIGAEPVFRRGLDMLRLPLKPVVFTEEPTRDEIPREKKWVAVYTPPGASLNRATPGEITPEGGVTSARSIEAAVRLASRGTIDGIVTAPISKAALHLAGFPHPGHTEMLRDLTGAAEVTMVLMTEGLRVGLVTIHIPLSEVPRAVTVDLILKRTGQVNDWLKSSCGIRHPRIAILALNPHAGESGEIGKEEQTILEPAIRSLQDTGVDCSGPYPADAFFARYREKEWDAVMAMYHDQGLIPLKSRAKGRGVNVTIGLPIIRTSPDHGTGFDIAGKGIADPSGMIEAAKVACALVRNRRSQ